MPSRNRVPLPPARCRTVRRAPGRRRVPGPRAATSADPGPSVPHAPSGPCGLHAPRAAPLRFSRRPRGYPVHPGVPVRSGDGRPQAAGGDVAEACGGAGAHSIGVRASRLGTEAVTRAGRGGSSCIAPDGHGVPGRGPGGGRRSGGGPDPGRVPAPAHDAAHLPLPDCPGPPACPPRCGWRDARCRLLRRGRT